MTQSTFIKLTLIVLLANPNYAAGQRNQTYVDSVNRYVNFVDSLINSYYSNPATMLSHTISHSTCASKSDMYGSGGSTDLYQDIKQTTIYQLSYSKDCDSISTERTFYFIKNKIVFAKIIDKKNKERSNYYYNDKFLSVDSLNTTPEDLAIEDLKDGYEVLKETQQ